MSKISSHNMKFVEYQKTTLYILCLVEFDAINRGSLSRFFSKQWNAASPPIGTYWATGGRTVPGKPFIPGWWLSNPSEKY